MNPETILISMENPVFHIYVIAASIMILKLMLQPWITVQRMMKVRAGYRSPEDAKRTPLNPEPREGQLEVSEYVDRSRRINLNDLESIPGFLFAGFLFVLSEPPQVKQAVMTWLACICLLDSLFLAVLVGPAPAVIAGLCFGVVTLSHRRIKGT